MRIAALAVVLFATSVGCSNNDATPAPAPIQPLAPARACADAIDAVYGKPMGLSPFSDAVRGNIVACAPLQTIPEAEVRQRMTAVPGATVVSGDVQVYLMSYRTAREPMSEAVSSALVYLPTKPLGARVPMVVAAHGTTGLSDACAPSRIDRKSVV